MEKTLNMGAFETLDSREMMEVDGGIPWPLAAAGGWAICKALDYMWDNRAAVTGTGKGGGYTFLGK